MKDVRSSGTKRDNFMQKNIYLTLSRVIIHRKLNAGRRLANFVEHTLICGREGHCTFLHAPKPQSIGFMIFLGLSEIGWLSNPYEWLEDLTKWTGFTFLDIVSGLNNFNVFGHSPCVDIGWAIPFQPQFRTMTVKLSRLILSESEM